MKKLLIICCFIITDLFPHSLQQKTSVLCELLAEARETQTRIVPLLHDIPMVIQVIDPGIKGMETINRLLKTRWNGDASYITDYARATIVVENFPDIYFCLEELKKHVHVLSIDDHYALPFPEMYRDINVVFADPCNGHIGEIQINSKPMILFKNTAGHDIFDKIRIIRAKEQLENRMLTEDEIKRIQELTNMSIGGYKSAFAMSHVGTRIGVYGICIQDKKVLMVKTQSGTKTIYNFPGGGVDDNEGFIDALKRECLEEIGCMTTVQQMICTSDRLYKHPDFDNNSFHLYYAMTIDSAIDSSIQEAQWFPIDKLPLDMMLEVDKSIIKFLV